MTLRLRVTFSVLEGISLPAFRSCGGAMSDRMKMHPGRNLAVVMLALLGISFTIRTAATPIAIDSSRSTLMKNALSWLTLREKGKLISDKYIEDNLLSTLEKRYKKSKAYRALVIAFDLGVKDRLTLGYGETCDYDYINNFRSPVNRTFDWHGMKKFTFENYNKRNDPNFKKQYCDYKQGLVCLPGKTCGCNPGATFQAISPGSSKKRCLLDLGQPCALPDLDQGHGHRGYKSFELPEVVFNLDKPEGCKPGTQCRNHNSDSLIPKCYDPATHSTGWVLPRDTQAHFSSLTIDIGDACPLGLFNRQVRCIRPEGYSDEKVGNGPGYICYNFAPEGTFTRTGFCAHDIGSLQVFYLGFYTHGKTHYVLWRRNFIMGFVNRRTVSLDAKMLKAYYTRYINEVDKKIFTVFAKDEEDTLKRYPGDSCNVAKTEALVPIWKYYAGLDTDPPKSPNDETSLNVTLDKLIELVKMNQGGFCQVYWTHLFPDYQNPDYIPAKPSPPLRCVKNANAKGKDNDGLCEVDPNDDGSTKPFADKVQRLSDYALEAFYYAKRNEDSNPEYLQILKDNPEPECKPKEKSPPQTRSLDALKNLTCPVGSLCLDNYEDASIFDDDCQVKPGMQRRKACIEVPGNGQYGKCEGMMLDKDIMKEVETIAMDKDALLGEGAKCNHGLENELRAGVQNGEWTGNKLELLAKLNEGRVKGTGVICDRSRLLECNDENVCACVSGTSQREFVMTDSGGGFHYKSDYCYLTSGECSAKGLREFLKDFPLLQKEIELINNHYGSAGEGNCRRGNHCLFVDQGKQQCTERNTGNTGHDGSDENGNIGGGLGSFSPPENRSPERRMLWKSIVGGLLTVILLVW